MATDCRSRAPRPCRASELIASCWLCAWVRGRGRRAHIACGLAHGALDIEGRVVVAWRGLGVVGARFGVCGRQEVYAAQVSAYDAVAHGSCVSPRGARVSDVQEIESLAPPFPLVTLAESDMQMLDAELQRFGEEWPLFAREVEPAARQLTLAWFRYCCPPAPSARALQITGRLLYTWYWFHDHKDDPDYRAHVQDFWAVLCGGHVPSDAPLVGAARAVLGDLEAVIRDRPLRHTRLFYFLGRTLAAFLWDRSQRGADPVEAAVYEAERTHTIFVQPWVEL